jgi:Flp pilus assembly protein TadB
LDIYPFTITSISLLTFILGLLFSISAIFASKEAQRRSDGRYQEIMDLTSTRREDETHRMIQDLRPGPETNSRRKSIADVSDSAYWEEVKMMVGLWGCLYVIFRLLAALGILVALASLVILLVGI